MEWISAVKRNGDNELCVEVQDRQGVRSLKYLKDVRGDLHRTGDIKNLLTIELNIAKPFSTTQYLADLELQHLDGSCQTAYRFDTKEGIFIIPSQFLIMSIMGTTINFRNALLKPWGPESFMAAFRDRDRVKYKLSPIQPAGTYQLSEERFQRRLRWLNSFPSAKVTWSSIYRNALEGQFNATLPMVRVTMSVCCRQVKNRFLVTKTNLATIEALEEAHAFVKGCTPLMSTSDKRITNVQLRTSQRKVITDIRVMHLVPDLRLTDCQWECIQPILNDFLWSYYPKRDRAGTHSVRLLMDAILIKLGTPLRWKNDLYSNISGSASVLFFKLKNSGTWERILEALEKQSKASALHALENENNEVLDVA